MIAIHYTSLHTSAAEGRIFGVQVAVHNWLRAWFRYGATEKFHFLIGEKKEQDEILAIAAETGIDPKRIIMLDRRYVEENLAQFEMIFRPNPDSHNLFWQRQQLEKGFGFCGLAHAIAGTEAGKLLEQYCLAPSEETDAIVCPSQAVKSAIHSFWNLYGDYLRQRFGRRFHCPVQLPVIPLGVDVESLEAKTTADKRAAQRQKLGLADDDIALLWVGRLSSAIKAHPLAMFQAAERAAEATGVSVHLLMVGYFMPKEAEDQFRKLAHDFCKKVKVVFIPSDDPHFPDGLWAAGDIFLSLIDNMQESFGLTPIEAMAAGLPRVISDWDGYRDSVEHEVDGFLVPTLQPPPGSGEALSRLLLNEREMYGGFLAKTALSVAVDQVQAAEALTQLIKNKNRRTAIAEKARARVRATYDWKHIIPAYEALWKDLADRRRARVKTNADWPSLLPQSPDPFTMYAAYPSRALREDDKLVAMASTEVVRCLWSHEINVLGLDVMLTAEDTTKLIAYILAQGETPIRRLFLVFPFLDRARLWRTAGWLIKLGILGVRP